MGKNYVGAHACTTHYIVHVHQGLSNFESLLKEETERGLEPLLHAPGCITFFLLIYGGSVAETRFDTGENNERDASLVREC